MFLNCFSDILTTRKPPSSSTSVFSTNSPARCMIHISRGATISLPGWDFLEGDSRGRSWGHNFFGFYLVRQNAHNYDILLWKCTLIHVCDLSLVWRFVLREKITTHYCTPMYLLGHYVFFISIYSFASSLSSFLVICSLIHSLNYSLARRRWLTRHKFETTAHLFVRVKKLGVHVHWRWNPDRWHWLWFGHKRSARLVHVYIFSHSSTGMGNMDWTIGLLDLWTLDHFWTIFHTIL